MLHKHMRIRGGQREFNQSYDGEILTVGKKRSAALVLCCKVVVWVAGRNRVKAPNSLIAVAKRVDVANRGQPVTDS